MYINRFYSLQQLNNISWNELITESRRIVNFSPFVNSTSAFCFLISSQGSELARSCVSGVKWDREVPIYPNIQSKVAVKLPWWHVCLFPFLKKISTSQWPFYYICWWLNILDKLQCFQWRNFRFEKDLKVIWLNLLESTGRILSISFCIITDLLLLYHAMEQLLLTKPFLIFPNQLPRNVPALVLALPFEIPLNKCVSLPMAALQSLTTMLIFI